MLEQERASAAGPLQQPQPVAGPLHAALRGLHAALQQLEPASQSVDTDHPRASRATRRLLQSSNLSQTEIIVIVVICVSFVLLLASIATLIVVIVRGKNRQVAAAPPPAPAPMYKAPEPQPTPAATYPAASYMPPSPDKPVLPAPPATQQQLLQQQQEQEALRRAIAASAAAGAGADPARVRQEFYQQQLEFVQQQQARAAEQLDLRARGPTLDASILVQRLVNHGEHEAAMTVAAAAGISHQVPGTVPGSMAAYPGAKAGPAGLVYLPPLQYEAPAAMQGQQGQGGYVHPGMYGQAGMYVQPGAGGGARPVPYAPAHTLLA